MKLSKILRLIVLVTAISLFYVHQQIEFVKLSYKIQASQHKLNDLLDQNKVLEYNVIALKTPYNIESQLTAHRVKLISPEHWQVVRVANPRIEKASVNVKQKSQLTSQSFFKIFTLSREAQAKPSD